MSELTSDRMSPVDDAVTEGALNGVPVAPAHGRHRSRWGLGNGHSEPANRNARLRLLAASAIGVGCLFVAHWLAPAQGSLFAAPSRATSWIAMIFGLAGVWMVPGCLLSVEKPGCRQARWRKHSPAKRPRGVVVSRRLNRLLHRHKPNETRFCSCHSESRRLCRRLLPLQWRYHKLDMSRLLIFRHLQ